MLIEIQKKGHHRNKSFKENETPIRYIINSGKDIEDDELGFLDFQLK